MGKIGFPHTEMKGGRGKDFFSSHFSYLGIHNVKLKSDDFVSLDFDSTKKG